MSILCNSKHFLNIKLKSMLVFAGFWVVTVVVFSLFILLTYNSSIAREIPPVAVFLLVGVFSIPGGIFIGLYFLIFSGRKDDVNYFSILGWLLLAVSALYGLLVVLLKIPLFIEQSAAFANGAIAFAGLLFAFGCSYLCWSRSIFHLFNHHSPSINIIKNKNNIMQNENNPISTPFGNRILIKGLTAGILIIVMWIPTLFIEHLVEERESRRGEVVQEVSSKWASAQTLVSPYLVIPYVETYRTHNGDTGEMRTPLVVLPSKLEINGEMVPEVRSRSIFNILLYRSDVTMRGSFLPEWPSDINPQFLDYSKAKLYWGLNDYKGIEEEPVLMFNQASIKSRPATPEVNLHTNALMSPVTITPENLADGIPFQLHIKVRGSEGLHFLPLAGNSTILLKSDWPNPSFDGNRLPVSRDVSSQGFSATWKFNESSLPVGTVFKVTDKTHAGESFGVSLVQPADQYAKTQRSIKYALMVIALTFGLFFVMEITSSRPFHPVQYTLVGLALAIFYTLLLSISEYIHFDMAYAISAVAVILLVTLYAKGHFKTWRAGGIFGGGLVLLYGFMFVLLRLEDTALLIGSVGLFIILSAIMYGSRKVDWYGKGEKRML